MTFLKSILDWIKSLFEKPPTVAGEVNAGGHGSFQMKDNFAGWIPDTPDTRDFIFENQPDVLERSTLPPAVDLRAQFRVAIENQGGTNTCVGHAVTSNLEAVTRSVLDRSRLFVYWNSRSYEGTTGRDSGTQIRNAMRGCYTFGVPLESLWPFVTSSITVKPNALAFSEALHLKPLIAGYARVTTLLGLKQALAAGKPVTFGFQVPETFTTTTRSTGHLPYPAAGARMLGGHAVVAVGYDDATGNVLVRNSYGPNWGLGGYFTMPYAWFANMNGMVADAWVITAR